MPKHTGGKVPRHGGSEILKPSRRKVLKEEWNELWSEYKNA